MTDPNEHSRYLICWHVHNSFHFIYLGPLVVLSDDSGIIFFDTYSMLSIMLSGSEHLSVVILSSFLRCQSTSFEAFIYPMWVPICLWNKLHSKPNNMELPSHIPCLHTYPCVKLFLESWYSCVCKKRKGKIGTYTSAIYLQCRVGLSPHSVLKIVPMYYFFKISMYWYGVSTTFIRF